MPTLERRVLLLALMASTLAGCYSAERRPPSQETPYVFHYTGEPPVWIFMPFPSITEDASGYPAQISVPHRRGYTTNRINRIEVVVGGEVVSPGVVRLYPGTTVLQAIGCAGGFTAYANNKRLRITKTSGQPLVLYLRSRRTANSDHRQVWYDTKQGADSGSDYVLDA